MIKEVQDVDLDKIVMDDTLQVRAKVDQATVKKYAEQMAMGVEFPPVHLAAIGDALFLVDGWHRLSAARRNGSGEIAAIVTPMTRAEATWEAAQANLKHGLPLKISERRAVFQAYVHAGMYKEGKKYKSYRTIAGELGGIAQHTTIRGWMQKDFRRIFNAMGDSEGHRNPDAGPPKVDLQGEYFRQAMEALDNALAFTNILENPTSRYEVIERADQVMKEMRKKENVEPDF